jgi:hypothetical protein
LEDIDDFNLHAELLLRELHALEASSYSRLQSLLTKAQADSRIEAVRARRLQMGDLLASLYKVGVSVRVSVRVSLY